jgi:CDP-6-deoxy-D-xylo-4-hexulose-3-dehydrase
MAARRHSVRDSILAQVKEYGNKHHASRPFRPGIDPVPVSGKVLDGDDLCNLVDAALDGWLTTGRFNDAFERTLRERLGRKFALTCNSGSSANLLAVAALTSATLGERALKPGDEVITVAAGFPTTVNPLLLYRLVPHFVDVDLATYNAIPEQVAAAIGPRTRAIMLAHTLGNPFDVTAIEGLCKQHGLWLIEDSCDALGSMWGERPAGSIGDISTFSFYPAHHITMGEGGAVTTDDPLLKRALESFRDWGRDCWCDPGRDNTCRKRYDQQFGDLPVAYDHKDVYSHAGFNLKITDMQAAIGLSQLDKLESFIATRRRNFDLLQSGIAHLADRLLLPCATPGSQPAWFGFPVTLNDPAMREPLLRHLDRAKIGSRLLFGGNLIHQPYFKGQNYLLDSTLPNSDRIVTSTLWLGCYPGLSEEMIGYMVEQLNDFFFSSKAMAGN